ncbi:MAG: hypothetical protein SNJ70_10780, partial [Armatimonadota bacterium]
SGLSERIDMSANVINKKSTITGPEHILAFGMTNRPIDNLKIDVGYDLLENQRVGVQDTQKISVTSSHLSFADMQASYSVADSSILGTATKADLALKAKNTNLELKGSLIDDYQASDGMFKRMFTLASSPIDGVRISANYAENNTRSINETLRGAGLEYSPVEAYRIALAFQDKSRGESSLRALDYSADIKPTDKLNFSGFYRDRNNNLYEMSDTIKAKIAYAPKNIFSLSGEYLMNPEDDKGNINLYNISSLSLRTKIGSVGISTAFTEKDEYKISKLIHEKNLQMDFPAYWGGRFVTGYSVARALGDSNNRTDTFSIGYDKSIGSDFNLSFTAQYIKRLSSAFDRNENEIKAEAGFGVRF